MTLVDEDFGIAQGDTLPEYVSTLVGADDQPVNLSAATVRFRMRLPGATAWFIDRPATYVNQAGGIVKHVWQAGDSDIIGRYQARFVVTFSDGRVLSFPNEGWRWIEVSADLPTGIAFATVDELQSLLGIDLGEEDEKSPLLLRRATALIQSEAHHRVFLKTNETKILNGGWRSELWLPEPPVVDVSSVALDGSAIADYSFTRRGKLTRGRLASNTLDWLRSGASWGVDGSQVTVVYTHGYAQVPEELHSMCLDVAARHWDNPSGLSEESAGSYSASYGSMFLTSEEKRVCRRYHVPEAA